MNRTARALLLFSAAIALDACASAPPPAPQVTARPRRPRRPRRPATTIVASATPTAATATPAPATTAIAPAAEPAAPETQGLLPTVRRVGAGSFEARPDGPSMGSPVVRPPTTEVRALTPRWIGRRSAPRIVCEGQGSPQRASMQSPYDPTNAMIARAFLPVERRIIACAPPVNREGRVPVRVLFSGTGLPMEVSLSADVTRPQGLCLGAALCGVRMAAFRAPNSTVSYAFVAALATDATPPESE